MPGSHTFATGRTTAMAKIAKTGDRKKVMDTQKSTDCPKCSKPTRIVKRVKDRERNVPGGVYIWCPGAPFLENFEPPGTLSVPHSTPADPRRASCLRSPNFYITLML